MLLLWNVVASVATVFLHELERMYVLLACILFPQAFHPVPNCLPGRDFLRSVINIVYGFIPAMVQSGLSKIRTAFSIDLVIETRMVRFEICSSVQSSTGNQVKLRYVAREPLDLQSVTL